MPCYTIQTVTVDAGKMDLDLAAKALAAMNLPATLQGQTLRHYAGSYNRATGEASWRGQDRTAEFKRHYSAQVVRQQAARMGWTLRQSKDNPWQFEAVKR